jgi:hypothetical protein
MNDDLYLCWCIFSTFISIYVCWFFSPRNKKFSDEEKMIIVTCNLFAWITFFDSFVIYSSLGFVF